jgi:DNA repair protein RadD
MERADMSDLRPYQEEAIRCLRQSLQLGNKRPVLQLPTGAGKTRVASAIIDMARAKGKRAIFTVPAVSLVDQTVDSFLRVGVSEVGVIQQAHEMTDANRPVQVASVQSLMRRPIPQAELVIVDECHRMFDFVHDWMAHDAWKSVPFIGLSATPWAKGLGRHYDDLVIGETIEGLIKAGHLSGFRTFAPNVPDLSGVGVQGGDYIQNQLSTVMGEEKLVADVVQTWLEKGEDRPTLCFAVDRAHAKHLQGRFEAAGVPTGYVDAYSTPEEREAVRKDFHAGTLRVVCNVGCLTTGVDWDVRCISLARPTKSEMLYVQMIGRGLRPAPGKADCLILDHSGTTLRLGFVTDIYHDKLDDGRERQKAEPKASEALPKPCPQCQFVKPPKMSVCPSCGFEAKHGPKEITCAAGELVELNRNKRKVPPTERSEKGFYAELKHVAASRGYKPGWAAAKFKDWRGKWPPRSWQHEITPREPSLATLNWIRSQNIAWAKAREKQGGAIFSGGAP